MRARCILISVAFVHAAQAQWSPQHAGTGAELRGLHAVDSRVVWASGTGGQVLHSSDGGSQWRVDTIPGARGRTLDLRAVWATSRQVAWAMSSGAAQEAQARIYRTSDGGAHWALQFTTEVQGVFLDAIAFWGADGRHGLALSDPVDGHFVILTTDDGGKHWARVPPSALPANLPGEAAFAASGSCLAVQGSSNAWIATGGGARARVFRSADRGRTWTVADAPVDAGGASAGLFSIAFRDARHGVAVGGDYRKPNERTRNVVVTEDGGRTWRQGTGVLPAGYMSAVSFVPGTPSTYVAVGLAGTSVSTDGGDSWTMVDSVPYNSVVFVGTSGWAVGPRGRIAAWRGSVGPTPGAR